MTTELSRSVLSIYRDWICISLDEDIRPISYQQTLDAFNYALDVLTEKQKLEDKLKLESKSSESTSKSNTGLEATIEVAIPAADVVEVKHGRWIDERQEGLSSFSAECSLCGKRILAYFHYYYCPNCGAKMDEIIEERKITYEI